MDPSQNGERPAPASDTPAPPRTIGEQQAEFDRWFAEWKDWKGDQWQEKTPESLLDFFKARLCWTLLGPAPGEG